MGNVIRVGALEIELTLKSVKHVHLSVHPPTGRVTLVAPDGTRPEVAHAYAASRLGWIRTQQARLAAQLREGPRAYVTRESHYVWGRRYLLEVREHDGPPAVTLSNRRLILAVRPGTETARRHEIMEEWYRRQMHGAIPALVAAWERRLGVTLARYFVQRMKTKWGSCNPRAGHIRLNTDLAKKPRDLLEYVVVHELAHLREPRHGTAFVAILDAHLPGWREARAELNALPLSSSTWAE